MTPTLRLGDCLEVLKTLEAESIDALVTDPPAGIRFMGRTWDTDHGGRKGWIAAMTAHFRECYRVMKPGAHGLVWAIPRTSHWTATALEDAGFEVREICHHLFGSGFPKSLDVSKAIDKMAGAEREVVGEKVYGNGESRPRGSDDSHHEGYQRPWRRDDPQRLEVSTAPATDAAKQWQGWGTSLKPAVERWILVRKPLGDRATIDASLGCLLSELAKRAELSSRSTHGPSVEAKVDSALAPAQTLLGDAPESRTPTGMEDVSFEATATSPSESTEKIALSIVSSWRRCWDARWSHGSTSITATASSTTTVLRTLNSLLSEITPESIIQAVKNPSGERSLVEAADALFSGLPVRSVETPTPSATEPAISSATSLSSSEAVSLLAASEHPGAPGASDVILIRKPLAAPNVASQVLATGTGALNVDGCRVGTDSITTQAKSPDASYAGTAERDSTGSHKWNGVAASTHIGRWPANLMLSCCGEEPHAEGCPVAELGSEARFFYTAKASTSERSAGLHKPGDRNAHPTVKATDLMRWLCRLITPPGGLILDPFMGSGSTGVAARLEGFGFVGIEKDSESFATAQKRLGWAVHEPGLFG